MLSVPGESFRIAEQQHEENGVVTVAASCGKIKGTRCGEVRERLNRAVSKTVEPSRVPWVRIPPSPPSRDAPSHELYHSLLSVDRDGLCCVVPRTALTWRDYSAIVKLLFQHADADKLPKADCEQTVHKENSCAADLAGIRPHRNLFDPVACKMGADREFGGKERRIPDLRRKFRQDRSAEKPNRQLKSQALKHDPGIVRTAILARITSKSTMRPENSEMQFRSVCSMTNDSLWTGKTSETPPSAWSAGPSGKRFWRWCGFLNFGGLVYSVGFAYRTPAASRTHKRPRVRAKRR